MTAKKPAFLISTEGKSKEQLKAEARQAFLDRLTEQLKAKPSG